MRLKHGEPRLNGISGDFRGVASFPGLANTPHPNPPPQEGREKNRPPVFRYFVTRFFGTAMLTRLMPAPLAAS